MYNNNVVSGRNMANNNESEMKVIRIGGETSVARLLEQIKRFEERIIRMERAYDALGRRLEGSERHVEDEGWFD